MEGWATVIGEEDIETAPLSVVSIFIDETAIRSAICWRANSRQTQGVFSLQNPQSNVSRVPPGSNRLVLPDVASSKMPLRPKF